MSSTSGHTTSRLRRNCASAYPQDHHRTKNETRLLSADSNISSINRNDRKLDNTQTELPKTAQSQKKSLISTPLQESSSSKQSTCYTMKELEILRISEKSRTCIIATLSDINEQCSNSMSLEVVETAIISSQKKMFDFFEEMELTTNMINALTKNSNFDKKEMATTWHSLITQTREAVSLAAALSNHYMKLLGIKNAKMIKI